MIKHYLLFLLVGFCSFSALSQGSETFSNVKYVLNVYDTYNWTGDNGLNWTATDTRTDQTMNGKCIVIRDGAVSCDGIQNGIKSLTFSHQQFYTGNNGLLEVYINGTKVGTANPTSSLATTTIDNINISGAFKLEIRQVTSKLRIGIDDLSWTAYNAAPCAEPTSQPTNLILTPATTTISGAFTASNPNAESYLIVRSTSNNLGAVPIDGTTYTPGSTLGSGMIVDNIPGNTFTDEGLPPASTFYYFIFANNNKNCGGAPNYLTTSPLVNNATTSQLPSCQAPTTGVTSLALTPTNNSISGTFTKPSGANRFLVIISRNAALTASPENGTTYAEGQDFGGGKIVSYGNKNTFTASGLTAATAYYVFVFAANGECTGEPFYQSTSTNSSTSTTNVNTGIPTGYYDGTGDLSCQPLKTKLRDIISSGYVELSYTPGIWLAFQYTDIRRNDENTANIIWDMYSDNPKGKDPYTFSYQVDQCGAAGYKNEGDCYNREHSTPQSWFNRAAPMVTDINHLFPTDGVVNNIRNNFPFGNVSNALQTSLNGSKLGTGNNFGYTGTVFEPIDEYKGDFARASLYMATRYENEIISQNWSANGNANELFLSPSDQPDAAKRKLQIYDSWYLKTIFQWIANDPVSQKEIDRNNAVYYQSGQKNRNPFIDHPEFALRIWECTGLLPVTLTSFTAEAKSNGVLLKWYASQESNFSEYVIERSTDGNNFVSIGTVQGKNLGNYSFTDNSLPTASYLVYRLKMVDKDGKFNYSKIASVRINSNASGIIVSPNPATDMVKISFKSALTENSILQIVDLTGRIVKTETVTANTIIWNQNVSKLPAGRYFIKISNSSEVVNTSFVIVR